VLRIGWIVGVVLASGLATGAEGVEAITRPSGDVTLAFVRPGRIAEVRVADGQAVRAGQVLVRQDDAAEQLQLTQLKAQAEDTIRIDAAAAQLAQKRVELQRVQALAERNAATQWELSLARLDVTIAELSVKLAEFQQQQARGAYDEARAQVDRMRLVSPIDGRVERVLLEAGEAADALEDVVRVVQIDPLWIDVPVPLSEARTMKLDQPARVSFSPRAAASRDAAVSAAPANAANGRVIHIAAVADAASDTLTVRVEVPNPASRPAGEHVRVTFGDVERERSAADAPQAAAEPNKE